MAAARRRSTRSASRGPRWPPGRTASSSGSRRRRTASARSASRPARSRSPRRATGSCSRTASCGPSWAVTAWCARWSSSARARGARRAGERPPGLRRPSDRVRRLGRRSVPPRDGRRLPAGDVVRGAVVRAAARRGGVRAAGRAGEHHAAGRAARRGRAAARVPLRGRLARVAHDAEGALPGGCSQPERDLPDAVRLHGAADPLLDEPRPGPLRGAGPPVRRPLRARLRRRAPQPTASTATRPTGTRCGSASCARRPSPTRGPTSAGTSSPTPSCRTPAAGARRAWSARRPGSRRRFAGRPAPPSRARSSRSTTRTWCSTP